MNEGGIRLECLLEGDLVRPGGDLHDLLLAKTEGISPRPNLVLLPRLRLVLNGYSPYAALGNKTTNGLIAFQANESNGLWLRRLHIFLLFFLVFLQ